MATTFLDFAAIKHRVSVVQAMQMLGLAMKQNGAQYRGSCPVCKSGGERALAINADKSGYYCFAQGKGGDVIALVAHVKGVSQREAAEALDKHFTVGAQPANNPQPRAPVEQGRKEPLKPLEYLQPSHEAVQALGVSEVTSAEFGAGYASKGIMRGRFAVPIHSKDGTLLAYVGIAVSEEQSPKLMYPNGFQPDSVIFGANRVSAGELYLVRDPLQVLTAFESGVENVVAFLSPISAQSLEMLAALMDEKKCEHVELF